MQFVTALALFVGALVALPYVAHRLRRRQAEPRAFAATHLVPKAMPKARRRSNLEDKALFGNRVLAVLALAVLGATPLVRCSRLSLSRGGASVALAIVVDDSMSMRARIAKGPGTRFARATTGAGEILASLQQGDAVAIVLAGAPPRVVLAPTTDLSAAKAALTTLTESDRATDLEGALKLADGLIEKLPQIDKRVAVLSDMADGVPGGEALRTHAPLWVPLPELAGEADDCAIIDATETGPSLRIKFFCNHGRAWRGRSIIATTRDDKQLVGLIPVQSAPGDDDGPFAAELTWQIPREVSGKSTPGPWVIRFAAAATSADAPEKVLAGKAPVDAIAADDAAEVIAEQRPTAIAVVTFGKDESVASGGAPLIEQALGALKTGIPVMPLPAVPDRAEDYSPFAGLIVDDAPGLTPEQRRALQHFLQGGGFVLLSFGPRSANALIGASFEPVLRQHVQWGKGQAGLGLGADDGAIFKDGKASLAALDAAGRITFGADDAAASRTLAKWSDGPPLLLGHTEGRGEAWMLGLPFGADYSDLPLRPGFLTLLDSFVKALEAKASPERSPVGTAWTLRGQKVEAKGPVLDGSSLKSDALLKLTRDGAQHRLATSLIGAYTLTLDGRVERRIAAAHAREVDFRPRKVVEVTPAGAQGESHPPIDVSWAVALVLLGAMTGELALRAFFRARMQSDVPSSEAPPSTRTPPSARAAS